MGAVSRAFHQTGFLPDQTEHHLWLGPCQAPQEESHNHPPPPPRSRRLVSVQEVVGLGMTPGDCAMEMGLVSLAIGCDTVEGALQTRIKCTARWKFCCGVRGEVVGYWMHWLGSRRALTSAPWDDWFSPFAWRGSCTIVDGMFILFIHTYSSTEKGDTFGLTSCRQGHIFSKD